jgi:hypothetical protein
MNNPPVYRPRWIATDVGVRGTQWSRIALNACVRAINLLDGFR